MKKFLYLIPILLLCCGLTPYEHHLKTILMASAPSEAPYTLVTITNQYTSDTNYTIGVNDIQITAYLWGAGGANGANDNVGGGSASGGAGGHVRGTILVGSTETTGVMPVGRILTIDIGTGTGNRSRLLTNAIVPVLIAAGGGGGGNYSGSIEIGNPASHPCLHGDGGGGGNGQAGEDKVSGSWEHSGEYFNCYGNGGSGTSGGSAAFTQGAGLACGTRSSAGSGQSGGIGGAGGSQTHGGNTYTISGGRGGDGYQGGGGGGVSMVNWCPDATAGGSGMAGGGAGGYSKLYGKLTNEIQNNASGTTRGYNNPPITPNKAGPGQGGCGALIIIRKQY